MTWALLVSAAGEPPGNALHPSLTVATNTRHNGLVNAKGTAGCVLRCASRGRAHVVDAGPTIQGAVIITAAGAAHNPLVVAACTRTKGPASALAEGVPVHAGVLGAGRNELVHTAPTVALAIILSAALCSIDERASTALPECVPVEADTAGAATLVVLGTGGRTLTGLVERACRGDPAVEVALLGGAVLTGAAVAPYPGHVVAVAGPAAYSM